MLCHCSSVSKMIFGKNVCSYSCYIELMEKDCKVCHEYNCEKIYCKTIKNYNIYSLSRITSCNYCKCNKIILMSHNGSVYELCKRCVNIHDKDCFSDYRNNNVKWLK